jgi:ferredoxin
MGEAAGEWRVTIDADRCVGSGNCVFWAPATFELDDDGVSAVLDPPDDDLERITVAVEGCPTRAISIIRPAAGDPGTEA